MHRKESANPCDLRYLLEKIVFGETYLGSWMYYATKNSAPSPSPPLPAPTLSFLYLIYSKIMITPLRCSHPLNPILSTILSHRRYCTSCAFLHLVVALLKRSLTTISTIPLKKTPLYKNPPPLVSHLEQRGGFLNKPAAGEKFLQCILLKKTPLYKNPPFGVTPGAKGGFLKWNGTDRFKFSGMLEK